MRKPLSTILYLRLTLIIRRNYHLTWRSFHRNQTHSDPIFYMHIFKHIFSRYRAPNKRSIEIAPETYGHANEDDELVPIITDEDILPEKLPMSCNCKKCKSDKMCFCRKNDLPCPEYCKCRKACSNERT